MKEEHIEPEAAGKGSKPNSEEISTSSMISISQNGQQTDQARVVTVTPVTTVTVAPNPPAAVVTTDMNRILSVTPIGEQKPGPVSNVQPIASILQEFKLELEVKKAVEILIKQYGFPSDLFDKLNVGKPQARVEHMMSLRKMVLQQRSVLLVNEEIA